MLSLDMNKYKVVNGKRLGSLSVKQFSRGGVPEYNVTSLISIKSDQSVSRTYNHRSKSWFI